MLAARWRIPVIAVALFFGTTGALVTSITGALAAHGLVGTHRRPVDHLLTEQRSATVTHWAAGSGRPGLSAAEPLRNAAVQRAPLVTDAVRPGGSKRGQPPPKVSRAMARANRIKQAQARRYLRTAHPPAARYLAATQRRQVRDNFCGPATVSEMLAQVGVVLNQPQAARELGTSQSGTDWSDAKGYPVPAVLNAHQKRTSYVATGLPWTPTSAQISTYITDLVADVSRGAGVPMAGNAYEVPGGPHLIGHPPGQEIMHWFDIRGYARSGQVTAYEDSVHGAPSIAWSGSVPAYSSLPSATIVDILGARGYVW
jgi:hypothetical protein